MKPVRTWVLVADAGQSKVYENLGPGKGLNEVRGEAMEHDLPPTREIGTDKPGRTFDSGGEGRHAMAPRVDWHEQAKSEFAKSVAARLNKAQQKNRFDRLVLVAPPKMLGELRAALSDHTAKHVSGEINKDLTGLTVTQIVEQVGAVAPV